MKAIRSLSLLLGVAALMLSTGCLTSEQLRAKRIEEHAAVFAQLPAEAQMRVQAGTIAIGDSATAAWFAFGEPAAKATNTTADGSTEMWTYMRTVSEPYQVLVYEQFPPPPPPRPGMRPPPPPPAIPHYETHYRFKEVPAMQITFLDGAIVQIQTF